MKLIQILAASFIVFIGILLGILIMNGLAISDEGETEASAQLAGTIVIISMIVIPSALSAVALDYFDKKLEQRLEKERKAAAYHGANKLYQLMCEEPRIYKLIHKDVPLFNSIGEEHGTFTGNGLIADLIRKNFKF